MIKPRAVRQLPECPTCRFYCGNPYLFCAVMPDGLEGDFCPHFAFDPDAVPEEEELWEPQGARCELTGNWYWSETTYLLMESK